MWISVKFSFRKQMCHLTITASLLCLIVIRSCVYQVLVRARHPKNGSGNHEINLQTKTTAVVFIISAGFPLLSTSKNDTFATICTIVERVDLEKVGTNVPNSTIFLAHNIDTLITSFVRFFTANIEPVETLERSHGICTFTSSNMHSVLLKSFEKKGDDQICKGGISQIADTHLLWTVAWFSLARKDVGGS